jgi:hypothetical protein
MQFNFMAHRFQTELHTCSVLSDEENNNVMNRRSLTI